MEAILPVPRNLTGRREETQEQLPEMIGPDAVEVVLSLAARLDEPGNPQERQMVADRGLALPQAVAKVGDVELAVRRQSEIEQDA
jgi:hypothetical protein